MHNKRSYFTQSGVYYNRDRHHTEMFTSPSIWPHWYQQSNINGNWKNFKRPNRMKRNYTLDTSCSGGLFHRNCILLVDEPNKWINQSDNRVKLMSTLATIQSFHFDFEEKINWCNRFTIKSGQSFILNQSCVSQQSRVESHCALSILFSKSRA